MVDADTVSTLTALSNVLTSCPAVPPLSGCASTVLPVARSTVVASVASTVADLAS